MQMNKQEKESVISAVLLLISLFFFVSCFSINNKGTIMQSARLLPVITCCMMILISSASLIKNVRTAGFPAPAKIWGSIKASVQDPKAQQTLFTILVVSIYIFLGIPFLGFYISSFILMAFIVVYCVRRIKPLYGILIALGLTLALYLLFRVGLNVRL